MAAGGVQKTLVRAFVNWADQNGWMALQHGPDKPKERIEEVDNITETFLLSEGPKIFPTR